MFVGKIHVLETKIIDKKGKKISTVYKLILSFSNTNFNAKRAKLLINANLAVISFFAIHSSLLKIFMLS